MGQMGLMIECLHPLMKVWNINLQENTHTQIIGCDRK
jgi:hypothetical protein